MVGGGFFEGFVRLRTSEAWDFFGEGNGVPGLQALREATGRYRRDRGADRDDPTIGCIILSDIRWFGAAALPAPPTFAKSVVQGRGYDPGEDPVVDMALSRLLSAGEAQMQMLVSGSPAAVLGPTHGEPTLVIPRLHQGAFRALVLDAYDSHCAVTGHRIRPTLQAAHIRPVSAGGEHRVDNGLLLRSDIHTLFDLGYVSVDLRHHLRVSPRLRDDFGNGDDLYALASSGEKILLPQREADRPAREFLEWHLDEVFIAA